MPKGKRKRKKSFVPRGLTRKVIMRKDIGPYAVTVVQETMDGALTKEPFVISAIAKDLGPNQYKNPFMKRVIAKGAAIRDFNLMCDTIKELITLEGS